MKYSIEGSTLTDIANAIREQYGEDSAIAVTDMAEAILGIEGGGGESGGDVGNILKDWVIGEFTVVSDTNEMQEIDYSELQGNIDSTRFLIHIANAQAKGPAYSVIGGQSFAGNGLITYSYNGSYGSATQWSNCPVTNSLSAKKIFWGPASGNYKFRAGYTYQYIIIPFYN